MAFCNSCGASLAAGATFCNKCGTAVSPAAPPPPMASATASPAPAGTPAQGSGVLKIVLIVVAVLFGLGLLSVGTVAFFVHRAISHTHIRNSDGNVKVETPFGSVESSDDADEAARNVGIDVYPGSKPVKGNSATMNIGGMKTATAVFDTDDPPATVAEFYRSKFPNANYTSSEDRYSIVARSSDSLFTVSIEPHQGRTRISVSKVTGKMVSRKGASE